MKDAEYQGEAKTIVAQDMTGNEHFLHIIRAYYDIALQKAREIHEKYSTLETPKKKRRLRSQSS